MARSTPKGIATIEEYGRYHYKGSTIPLPQVLLPWAINFLADEDVDRTVGWTEKFAELTEYLAHLHYTFSLEDWGPQMKEAVDMLNTHRIFGNYYYGHPKLNLDFTVNAWPKESRRLPRLPGPDMELRRESDGQKELNGPRLLQHLDIVSAHDQQYEMPVDILKKCYLQPYLTDALAMWNAGLPAAHMDSINLAHHENKYYEAGMENGIVRLARFLNGDIGRFRYNPQDVTESEGSRVAKRASLLSFAMFRGAKRAAIQQCLNVFNGSENRKMCTPWRTLNLPAPQRKQKPDAGIIFSNHLIKDAPPERERRDPWAYTRAHRRYRKEEEAWAAWTREHTLKVAWKLKLSERGGGPVMELPKTWKGLYPPDVMDLEMKRRYELLRRCQIIRQGLKRAARRAPRPFISGLIEMVDAGSRGEELQGLDLRFAAHEFTPECAAELALIRPTEAAWLEYIYQPSRNRPTEPKEPIDSVGAILISRVKEMLRDVSPVSLFGDLKPKSMKEFLNGLNGACGGPIGRHRFTESEVRDLASTLHSMKILKVLRQRRGELQFARPETEFHPEILIVWPGSAKQKADAAEVGEDGRAADGKSVAASKSSHLTVPASIDDFMEYPEQMPRKKDVLSLEDYILNPTNNPEDQERTNNLFRCLAYRLGLSLRGLKAIRRQDIGIIRNPDLQIQNADFLGTMVSIWTKDTRTRPNNPRKNPRKVGTHRETLTAPDVVKMADPEHFREEWLVDEWPGEHQARGIVRRNLVRELSENKTMIWPVQLPYDRWTKEYAVPNPNPQISLPDEYVGKEKSVLRREPIWTFGHTSRKPRAHLFWDVNSWPLSALSRETRERVRRRGPKNQHDQRGQKQGSGGEERPSNSRPSKIRYWKKAEEKRVFVPGAQEFWLGDTPLQRKVIEQRFRERFERRKPKKRTWTERVADALFGQEEKPTSPEDFALPDVDPSSIPESRPAKRPRLNESFESVGSSQVPQCPIGPSSSFSSALNGGIPGGEKTLSSLDAGLTITGADNKVLRYEAPGSAKAMRLLEKLRVEKGRASVTYKIPEGGQDDDPPLIIYYKPEVIVEM
ncbi:hypothetical protein ESCO_000226 [Escovopsis weberi]|uniref:Uncharacterized protein n=1 Tax=Escovopsis weberi TaxID=150374 RepID=A0A0M8MU59_ESCWE|nr:hypothetical protein ESCO_000226 [Escovopsis weberi]